MRFCKAFAVFVSLILSLNVFADEGNVSGKVEYIRVHDAETVANWAPPKFWITIENVTSAGSCQTHGGKVLFASEGEELLSTLLAAHFAGKDVNIRWTDVNKVNGFCKVVFITIGDPANFS